MPVKKFFLSAVYFAFDIIGSSGYFRVFNKSKKVREAVLDKASYGSYLFMSIPPTPSFSWRLSVGSFIEEGVLFFIPVIPLSNPSSSLSFCSDT